MSNIRGNAKFTLQVSYDTSLPYTSRVLSTGLQGQMAARKEMRQEEGSSKKGQEEGSSKKEQKASFGPTRKMALRQASRN